MTVLTLSADGLDPLTLADIASVRSFEWASGALRTVSEEAPDADGEIDTSLLHAAGSITIGLRITSSFESRLRRLRSFTHGRLRPTLTIDWEDGESDQMIATLSQGVVTAPVGRPTHRDAVVQFQVPAGVLESADLHEEVIHPGAGATDGVEFGTTVEFGPTVEFPSVDPPGTIEVTNAGDRDAYPVIRAYGPFGAGGADETTIGNETTGDSLLFTGLAIAAGDYLEVDFRAKKILVNGLAAQSRYQYLTFPDSTWWTLRPGVNEVSFRPDTFSGNSQAVVLWRDAYS